MPTETQRRIRKLLRRMPKEDLAAAKQLSWTELNYDHATLSLSDPHWPERACEGLGLCGALRFIWLQPNDLTLLAGLDAAVASRHARSLQQRARHHVYRSPNAMDPTDGYGGKPYARYYQTLRAVIRNCVSVDAHFLLVYRERAPDRHRRLRGVEGLGAIEGPAIEYHLFAAGTGVDWPEEEFWRAAEQVCTPERELQLWYWVRDHRTDKMVLPYFSETELVQSLFLDKPYSLDRAQFRPVMDEF